VSDIRANRGALITLAVAATLVPGLGLYAVLRVVGLGIGPAGVLGLLTMMASMAGFTGWAFKGVRRG
jgi:hypothetical protein